MVLTGGAHASTALVGNAQRAEENSELLARVAFLSSISGLGLSWSRADRSQWGSWG